MMKAAVERGWLDERAAVLEVRPGSVVYRADKQTILPAVAPRLKMRYSAILGAGKYYFACDKAVLPLGSRERP